MRILIDISHPAHANFFKTVAVSLKNKGDVVIISVLQRGNLLKIVKNEYPDFVIIKSGNYNNNKLSIIFQANIQRFFKQLRNVIKYKIDLGLSCGSFTLGAALSIIGKPNFQFDDDPERKMNVFLEKMTATKVFFPPIIGKNRNIAIFNALKEWSYLSPKYFVPDISSLNQYQLDPKAYIFIREVQTKSLNYSGQTSDIILSISQMIPKEINVLLSLENKSNMDKYPSHWKILQEPVKDIHSLIYYCQAVLSSGDSMAREGAMLGVPSIYCGFREMRANDLLKEQGMLFKILPEEVSHFMQDILNEKIKLQPQEEFRNKLCENWIDVNELILNLVRNIKEKL